ncbi:MAG: FAD-dependent oxidoreductase, partial [Myxococcales bacterium]|nr:FAD-dependent oxidoreductase [Myxococcales bacterium]
RILGAYEEAEREPDEARRRWLLTFVVVGGGPTGVELAGALNEISRHTMRQNFRNFDPGTARVVLVEGGPRILPTFAEKLATKARKRLARTGVEVKVGVKVTAIDERGVALDAGKGEGEGDERPERLDAATVLWAAGVRGAEVGKTLGVETDRGGRVPVTAELALPGHPRTYVVGDLARVAWGDDGDTVPGIAPAAIQMGAHAAENVKRQINGEAPTPFHYRDKGAMATVGRAAALVDTPTFKLFGFLAWLMWVFIHILYLASFRNRVVVLFEWAWAYFSWNRPGRIILERPPRHGARPLPPDRAPGDSGRPADPPPA